MMQGVQVSAVAVLMAGTFIIVLDFFIVNVALPSIQMDLQASARPPQYTRQILAAHQAVMRSRLRRSASLVSSSRAWDRVQLAGVPDVLFDPEIADEDGEAVEAFVPIHEPIAVRLLAQNVVLGEVPAAQTAVLVHASDYGSLSDTYRILGAWVARHAAPSGERIREWYRIALGYR